MTFDIRAVELAEVRRLRHIVLRPHQSPEELAYGLDDDGDAAHLGAFEGDELVAIASITRESPPDGEVPTAWRVRGMATLPDHRNRGLGGALLERCLDHARERGGTLAWLNGRTPAAAFYERRGFTALGPEFEPPGLGPHREFRRTLR